MPKPSALLCRHGIPGLALAALAVLGLGQQAAVALPVTGEGATTAAGARADDAPQQVPEWAVERAARLGGGVRPEDVMGPHRVEADLFHPERDTAVRPALGGRIIMHLPSQPANLAYPIENSAATTTMLNELHAGLLRFNWETLEQDLLLAESMDIEDTLILKGGRSADNGNILFGKVTDAGDHYRIESGSAHNPLQARDVPKAEVESLQRGTVFTFKLRDGVRWHDGHALDAADVVFSMELYRNPAVDCDQKRFQFLEIVKSEQLDRLVCRFFYREQYFKALEVFNDTLCLLPSHLYNLADPDNKDHDPQAGAEKQGTYINENPHNINWVGLGPYKLSRWERGQYVEAVRFDDYFEPEPWRRGYADVLRWRFVDNDDSAFQALLNGELDIFWRVKTEDYFGEATAQRAFTSNFYKAYTYVGTYGYTGWNSRKSKLSDPTVRTALALAFDSQGWIDSKYFGLAVRVTGPQFFTGPAYNHEVVALPYDPQRAEDLLAEAGWYDRNGDGTIDKDGEELVIEWLMPSGNKASESYGQALQESFARIGVGLRIHSLEWASFLDRILNRDFDACNLAWVLPSPESDPWQIWHSSEAVPGKRSSNHAGMSDAQVDRLIEAGRIELDSVRRNEIWQELHARIYELQPYLFSQNPPYKLAINRKLRGVKLYNYSPAIRLREMYYPEGTPGTRPLKQD